ncbi:hypothetical protein MMUR_00310 [Mycolicibacterium murale]|uniref:Uncharacterized protein n=1 Tax=Mycolicibacterium murale TaxID=182220 RepID=A0A7I9WDT6_9MYCO|nr:hypothetical protein MMUR_00310 [Mycolicibacterium murale]
MLTERAQRSREDHTSSTPAASSRRDIGLSVQTRHGGAMNRLAADHRAVRGDAMERAPLNVPVDDAPSGCEPPR